MTQFENAVKALTRAQEAWKVAQANFEADAEFIEVWEPFSYKVDDAKTEWLKDRGCIPWKWVPHESYNGYGTIFLCPKGTREALQAIDWEALVGED